MFNQIKLKDMKKNLFIVFVLLCIKSLPQCVPSVGITVYNGPLCAKRDYNLIAMPVANEGTTPIFQWFKNGSAIPNSNNIVYPQAANTLVSGDVITLIMTSSLECAAPVTATSTLTISYLRAVFPTSLSVSPVGTVLPGTPLTFTETVDNHPAPNTNVLYGYEFYINGVHAPYNLFTSGQTTNSTVSFTTNTLFDGDVVFCTSMVHVAGNPCGDIDTSNSIAVSIASVLPITISDFDVQSSGDRFLLNWTTSTETNSDYFNVQASTDGFLFNDVGKIRAAGTSSIAHNYNYVYSPTLLSHNPYFFRLQLADKGGSFAYSATKKANLTGISYATISPNPAKDIINVNGANNIKEVQLFDMSGKLLLYKLNLYSNNAAIDVAKIAKGIYLLRVTNSNDEVQVQKVILQ